ncbi:hypothetical protein EVAR_103421_1 [Eumeta japonica]|uniref:Uncharacterized protein n=1 Tax=Eumeta variegata TaxID=151549 RepID=A0A4C1ZAN1_EUMVA|nr:hypothetical protein EVAR_103421_1 [Eumeta japonica]
MPQWNKLYDKQSAAAPQQPGEATSLESHSAYAILFLLASVFKRERMPDSTDLENMRNATEGQTNTRTTKNRVVTAAHSQPHSSLLPHTRLATGTLPTSWVGIGYLMQRERAIDTLTSLDETQQRELLLHRAVRSKNRVSANEPLRARVQHAFRPQHEFSADRSSIPKHFSRRRAGFVLCPFQLKGQHPTALCESRYRGILMKATFARSSRAPVSKHAGRRGRVRAVTWPL